MCCGTCAAGMCVCVCMYLYVFGFCSAAGLPSGCAAHCVHSFVCVLNHSSLVLSIVMCHFYGLAHLQQQVFFDRDFLWCWDGACRHVKRGKPPHPLIQPALYVSQHCAAMHVNLGCHMLVFLTHSAVSCAKAW
ncbi:hypothetical protein COO60DRAFT_1162363 [Scenedesmus sp. NREL 46B-D3]|nr:hypothetical protein COO60DRAFT_1162363 [Scenedesmus sp. NREL 46B-D3]